MRPDARRKRSAKNSAPSDLILNHASAVLSLELNQAMMNALRKWYRSGLIQPVLVTLMLFQVVSGVTLLWRATAAQGDLYRTLQTSTARS